MIAAMSVTPEPSLATYPFQPLEPVPDTRQERRNPGFYMVGNDFMPRYGALLGGNGLGVWMALKTFANKDGECFPSQATIAKIAGISRMQVSREITKLKRLGLVEVKARYGKHGGQTSNLYILHDRPLQGRSLGGAREGEPFGSGRGATLSPSGRDTERAGRSLEEPRPDNHVPLDELGASPTREESEDRVTESDTPRNSQLHPPVTESDTPCNNQLHKNNTNMNNTQGEQNQQQQARARRREQKSQTAASETQKAVVVALSGVGISEKVAEFLADKYSEERITEKIAYLEFLQGTKPESVKNPCGWLRTAIVDDYARPDGFMTPEEREQKAADEAQKAQEAAEQAQEIAAAQQASQEKRKTQEAERRQEIAEQYGIRAREIDLWQQVLGELKLQLPEATFHAFLSGSLLLSLDDEQAVIGLANHQAKDWVENRLSKNIQFLLAMQLERQKVAVVFTILEECMAPAAALY